MKVHTIDLRFQGVPGVIAAYLLESGGEVALIETGPGSTLERLRDGILECGVALERVTKVFVTHVHLDHAGAAGWWANQGAQVFCHPRAERHLVEPSRLIEGARQVYGAAFDSLWGEVMPAPQERVTALRDGEEIAFGDERIGAIETPGHARHHHAFAVNDVCFTGDVAGVKLEESAYLSVAAAPPQFEPEPYLQSVKRLREREFSRLYLTHFGMIDDPHGHLMRYEERVREVAAEARRSNVLGLEEEAWRARFEMGERERCLLGGDSTEIWGRYQVVNGTSMCADGLRSWASSELDSIG
jgi:glyoxylase-like metal-dependent hydrolase (beta-lactamase superfamily II)